MIPIFSPHTNANQASGNKDWWEVGDYSLLHRFEPEPSSSINTMSGLSNYKRFTYLKASSFQLLQHFKNLLWTWWQEEKEEERERKTEIKILIWYIMKIGKWYRFRTKDKFVIDDDGIFCKIFSLGYHLMVAESFNLFKV